MYLLKKYFTVVIGLLAGCNVNAQQFAKSNLSNTFDVDSIRSINNRPVLDKPTHLKSMYLPAMLMAYGAVTFSHHGLESINGETREAIFSDHPHSRISIDNYLQFVPGASVYGLNALGIKGKSNLRDRSMIFFMSNLFLNTTVFSVKNFTRQLRPDGSAKSSFPSGHTAEAFANAEFLRTEYKDVSAWYGIAGYAVAATTGYLRMYNNKHWLSDVVAGAGVGIASTRLAYWLYPKLQHRLFKDKPVNTTWLPSYQSGGFTLSINHNF